MLVTPDIVTPDPIIQRSGRLPAYFIAKALSTKALSTTALTMLKIVVWPQPLGRWR